MLGGDLNCPLDPLLDKKGGTSTKRKSGGRAKNVRSRVHG